MRLLCAFALVTLVACTGSSGDDAESTNEGASVATPLEARFAFASPSPGTELGHPGNEDVLGIGPWVMSGWTSQHDRALDAVIATDKIPFVYLYIVAGLARSSGGLQDCNVGAAPDKTLCVGGAAFVRNSEKQIVDAYATAAKAISARAGTRPVIVHVEPDFYQYSGGDQSAPLVHDESARIMSKILQTVHGACASCRIAVDVSPWCPDLAAWYAGFDLSHVTYAALVGKALPATTSPIDRNTYARIHAVTGKPVIVGNAYGPGGVPLPFDRAWDDREMLQQLAGAGVAIGMQPNTDRVHYAQVIDGYRSRPVFVPTVGDWHFTRSPNINAHWAEVSVDNAPVKVEAIVEGESWHELSKQTWGSWAANFGIASGSKVVFRAWDPRGAPHDSEAFVWP